MVRGEIWWAHLPEPVGAEPGFRRPVLIVSANSFNRSRIATINAVVLTSNLRLAEMPGNVLIAASNGGLSKDSVANVSQLITVDKRLLDEKVDRVSAKTLKLVEHGLQLVLGL